jgi:glycosyltransferase involved in cell wall biosynthesis
MTEDMYKNLPKDFDSNLYIELNEDLQHLTDTEAKNHYINYGINENRVYNYKSLPNDFDSKVYIELNKDLHHLTDNEAKLHYLKNGIYECRQYKYENTMNNIEYYEFGVNIIYSKSTNGLNKLFEHLHKYLINENINFNLVNLNDISKSYTNYYKINLIISNAQGFEWLPNKLLNNKYNIGIWSWESENFKIEWSNIKMCDEIWTISEFLYDIRDKCRQPVFYFNFYNLVNCPNFIIEQKTFLNKFKIPNNKFIYSFMYDTQSSSDRKNIHMLLECFNILKQKYDDIFLLLKINNYNDKICNELFKDKKNIILITERLTQSELSSFYRVSNLYVSPHKAEGLGYTILESIENDCPVLATNYGGFKDIIEDDFIKLNYKKTISKNKNNVYSNHIWCDPQKSNLLELMEKYYLNKDLLLDEIKKSKNKLKKYDPKINSSKIFKRLCSVHYFVNECYDIKYTKDNSYNIMSPTIYKYLNPDLFNITDLNNLIEHHNTLHIRNENRISGFKINNSFFNNLQKKMLFDKEFYIKSNKVHNITVENKENEFYYNNYVSKKTFISKQVKNIFNKYIQSQIHVSKNFNEKIHSIIYSGNHNDYILNIKNFKKIFFSSISIFAICFFNQTLKFN